MIVIGSGPGGYVAAIRAAQLGMKTACVERDSLGGTCLNIGCIPSKALLDSTERLQSIQHLLPRRGINASNVSVDLGKLMAFKDDVVKKNVGGVSFLFKKNKIDHLQGHGRITSPTTVEVKAADGSTQTYNAAKILIATGSAPVQIPSLPFDGKFILSSTEALSMSEIPKRMIVVGGGYIGVEMGSVWSRLGSEVIVMEFFERILLLSDQEMALGLQRLMEKQGLKFRFKTTAESAKVENDRVKVSWKSGDETGVEEVDKVLVCVGRRPVTDNLGLDTVGVKLDKKGYIPVDKMYQTNIPGIYAIGDVIGGLMLAHKAEEEGVACVELMAGKFGHVAYRNCPSVVYTHPELAQVGLTEEEATKQGPVRIGKFPFSANGRARGMDETDGLVKIIADAKTDKLLGVHILGAHASDMIAEPTVAMEMGSSAEDIARSFHAHPTMPEAIKEAALAVEKRAIHI
ncbi:MAG: dihydrolipoyl dehydrogenase [Phycisphaerae bacterium]|nr:dihydrolipoyl dehydrogenase [Phycisphaerae bacterium]